MRPPQLTTEEVVFVRQEVRRQLGQRGIYKTLTAYLNAKRRQGPWVRRNTVFSAATGLTYRYVDEIEDPVPTNPHHRPHKLSKQDVRRIVQLLDNRLQVSTIAHQFGVSQEMITQINTGRRHAWATKGQSIAKRIRHRQVKLSREDSLCLLSCAESGWWRHDTLAEVFGLPSRQAVASRVKAARDRRGRV